MDKLTLTVMETARTLNISKNVAYALMRKPGFPSIRVGGRWIVPVAALERWLAEQAEEKALV